MITNGAAFAAETKKQLDLLASFIRTVLTAEHNIGPGQGVWSWDIVYSVAQRWPALASEVHAFVLKGDDNAATTLVSERLRELRGFDEPLFMEAGELPHVAYLRSLVENVPPNTSASDRHEYFSEGTKLIDANERRRLAYRIRHRLIADGQPIPPLDARMKHPFYERGAVNRIGGASRATAPDAAPSTPSAPATSHEWQSQQIGTTARRQLRRNVIGG